MGRLVLVGRLAARDLQRRRGEAVMLLVALTAALTALTLGLVLRGVTSQPYQTTGRQQPARTCWPPRSLRAAGRPPTRPASPTSHG